MTQCSRSSVGAGDAACKPLQRQQGEIKVRVGEDVRSFLTITLTFTTLTILFQPVKYITTTQDCLPSLLTHFRE